MTANTLRLWCSHKIMGLINNGIQPACTANWIHLVVWTQHFNLLNKSLAAQNKHLAEIIHMKHVLVRCLLSVAFISTLISCSALGVEMVNFSSETEENKNWHWSSESRCERTWLTLGWQQGKENKCTLPKSSAEASRDPSCDLHTALMSVPSAPSGQIPEKETKQSSKDLI